METLHAWCTENQLVVNHEKSKVIHFRPQSVQSTHHTFTVGEKVIGTETQYTYLGLLLIIILWPNMLQNQQTLGLVISRYKALGGLPYNSFTKLYDSVVYSTISYGAAIWGDKFFLYFSGPE